MKPTPRFLFLLLAPPALGTLLMLGWVFGGAVLHGRGLAWLHTQSRDIALSFFYAYLFGLAPSAAYAALMEAAFRRGLLPGEWPAVWYSTALGLAAGAGIMLLVGAMTMSLPPLRDIGYFAAFGTIVGFILGAIVRFGSRRDDPSGGVTERFAPDTRRP
jgi:hypothetical protein